MRFWDSGVEGAGFRSRHQCIWKTRILHQDLSLETRKTRANCGGGCSPMHRQIISLVHVQGNKPEQIGRIWDPTRGAAGRWPSRPRPRRTLRPESARRRPARAPHSTLESLRPAPAPGKGRDPLLPAAPAMPSRCSGLARSPMPFSVQSATLRRSTVAPTERCTQEKEASLRVILLWSRDHQILAVAVLLLTKKEHVTESTPMTYGQDGYSPDKRARPKGKDRPRLQLSSYDQAILAKGRPNITPSRGRVQQAQQQARPCLDRS